jgi:hypothetical protein
MRPIVRFTVLAFGLYAACVAPATAGERALAMADAAATEPVPDNGAYTPLDVSIPHHLSEKEAERRVRDALAGLQKDYGFLLSIDRQEWRGPHLRFQATILGQPANGRIDVGRTRVDLRVKMPSSLSLLASIAQPVLLKQGTQLLARQ